MGRTGSLIAIDVELQRAQKEGVVDPFNYVLKMRDQRNLTIQTEVYMQKSGFKQKTGQFKSNLQLMQSINFEQKK